MNRLKSVQDKSSETTNMLGEKLQEQFNQTMALLNLMQDRVDSRLQETSTLVQTTHQTVGARLDKNYELFGKVQERLGKIEQTSLDIKNVGREISELQNLFKTPKLRGNLGEQGLEQILGQILPKPHYAMQYSFKSNVKVDAVIKLAGGKLVPIDAKFPYENFKRMMQEGLKESEEATFRKAFQQDLKKHIDDISQKYIRPTESTLDFALMYIPAEHVYYESILKDDRFGEYQSIHQYALRKRVIPVSPNSIYAYLQAIALGLRGLRIEERASEIFKVLDTFKRDLSKLSDEMGRMGKHLSNAYSVYESCGKRVDRVTHRLENLQDDSHLLTGKEDA
ncbi:MAG: DNA recombination protein RmuC [Bdellovibrionales bacterium]|nr:DNA recombination protein RmuC [Bdellovibrionales bacterium]